MALKYNFFSDHVFEFKNNEITGLSNVDFFIRKGDEEIPEKILNWMSQSLKLSEKTALSSMRNHPSKINNKKKSRNNDLDWPQTKTGLILWLKEGEKKNIQINYTSLKTPVKNFLFLEKNSSLNWIEHYLHNKPFFVENYICIQKNANVFSLRIDQEENKNIHKTTPLKTQNKKSLRSLKLYKNIQPQNQSITFCHLHDHSCFFSLDINLNSTSRKIYIHGQKPHCVSIVRGLNLLTYNQQADQFIFNQKDGPFSYSRQFYRSVLSKKAKNFMHSKVIVNAQHSDSNQMIQNLILSPFSKAQNKPELIIKKDQVKATHGTTTGQLNPMEMFYMNTRGLSNETALEFLVTGWVDQIFDYQDSERLPQHFKKFQQKITPPLKNFLHHQIKNILTEKEIKK